MTKRYTAYQIYKSKKIYWVRSYKCVLKYMRQYAHILEPIVIGEKSGQRYFVSEENIKKFVKMFENNKL